VHLWHAEATGLRKVQPVPPCNLSRRRFLRYGASSLVLGSLLTRAQSGSAPNGSSEFSTAVTTPDSLPIIASTDDAAHMTIDVRIDGRGPYRFVIDTGADRSVLATDVAAELNLKHAGRALMEGVVRAMAADTVTVNTLSFGPIKCQNLVIPTLPRSMLRADGYLGLDALDGHRVTFDFKNRRLRVIEPRSRLSALWVRPDETRVRTSGSAGHLRAVDCLVDGVTATAFVDTGAEVSAGNSSLLAALSIRKSKISESDPVTLTDITGGQISGYVTLVEMIQLKELQFTGCPLVIADFKIFDVWGLREHPALLIGMNILRRFSIVSIDYGLKELRFDLTHSFSSPPASATSLARSARTRALRAG
jgi:predicted aspartyl protease